MQAKTKTFNLKKLKKMKRKHSFVANENKKPKSILTAVLPLIELIIGNILNFLPLSNKLLFSQTCRTVRKELVLNSDYQASIKTENFLQGYPEGRKNFFEILQDTQRANILFKLRNMHANIEEFIKNYQIKAIFRRVTSTSKPSTDTIVYEIYKFGLPAKYLMVRHIGSQGGETFSIIISFLLSIGHL